MRKVEKGEGVFESKRAGNRSLAKLEPVTSEIMEVAFNEPALFRDASYYYAQSESVIPRYCTSSALGIRDLFILARRALPPRLFPGSTGTKVTLTFYRSFTQSSCAVLDEIQTKPR